VQLRYATLLRHNDSRTDTSADMYSRLLLGLTMAALAGVACGTTDTKPAALPTEEVPPPRGEPNAIPGEVRPRIISISPDTMSVHDGVGTPGSYSLEYVINEIEKVESGMLQITAPGIGVLAKIPFTPSAEGSITFDIDPSRVDLGPTVAFRARCPEGETEWYTLGARLSDEERSLSGPRITGVSPDRISLTPTLMRNEGEIPAGAGVPVTIRGNQLTSDCSLDATVNGGSIELNNLLPDRNGFRGLLLYRDISNREVSARHLEVHLVVDGPGFGSRGPIGYIRFVE
jgi:hypothetical protein